MNRTDAGATPDTSPPPAAAQPGDDRSARSLPGSRPPAHTAEPAWLVAFRQLAAEALHRRDQDDDRLVRAAQARAARREAAGRAPESPVGPGRRGTGHEGGWTPPVDGVGTR